MSAFSRPVLGVRRGGRVPRARREVQVLREVRDRRGRRDRPDKLDPLGKPEVQVPQEARDRRVRRVPPEKRVPLEPQETQVRRVKRAPPEKQDPPEPPETRVPPDWVKPARRVIRGPSERDSRSLHPCRPRMISQQDPLGVRLVNLCWSPEVNSFCSPERDWVSRVRRIPIHRQAM